MSRLRRECDRWAMDRVGRRFAVRGGPIFRNRCASCGRRLGGSLAFGTCWACRVKRLPVGLRRQVEDRR